MTCQAPSGTFWQACRLSDDRWGRRGPTALLEAVEPAYAQASPRGLDLFLGTAGGGK